MTGQSVDHFIHRAVAAACNHQLAVFTRVAVEPFPSRRPALGFGQFRLDAAGGKNSARLIQHAAFAQPCPALGLWINSAF